MGANVIRVIRDAWPAIWRARAPVAGESTHAGLARWLDRIEQVVIVALWAGLVHRVAVSNNPLAGLLLLSETSVLVLVLIRRSTTAISVRPADWFLAIVATGAPLLITPGPSLLPHLAGLAVGLIFGGNLVQVAAKLALRRSFGIAPANRGVKVSGLYAFVRHPMYAGYLLVHVGVMIAMPSWSNLAIYAIGWCAQIRRMLMEEALLGKDEAYRAYAARVRWRLVPGVF